MTLSVIIQKSIENNMAATLAPYLCAVIGYLVL